MKCSCNHNSAYLSCRASCLDYVNNHPVYCKENLTDRMRIAEQIFNFTQSGLIDDNASPLDCSLVDKHPITDREVLLRATESKVGHEYLLHQFQKSLGLFRKGST